MLRMNAIPLNLFIQVLHYLANVKLGAHFLIACVAVFGSGSPCTPPLVPGTVVVNNSPSPDTFVNTSKDEPNLTIFYDAMDESSQVFFKTTFINQRDSLPSNINIDLIPCQQVTENAGSLSCSAQADPTCKLNIMHSCAIAQITNKKQLINYLACTMKNTQSLPDFTECANQAKVNDVELQQCANSDKGKNLCKDYTLKKMADMNTLPGLIFKKPDDIKASDLFQYLDYFRTQVGRSDLLSAICAKLKASKASSPPLACNEKLIVGIFYKTMDEKSQKWFHTLGSVYDEFKDYIIFKYEPCMMAERSADGKLDCQDPNDKDCIMGKTHACAISHITNPMLLFRFLNCTMQGPTIPSQPDLEKCATGINIQYEPIKTCVNSELGKNICHNHSKTRPKFTDFPSFSYELTFDENLSKKTSESVNLKSIFCDQLKNYGITYPTDCKSEC